MINIVNLTGKPEADLIAKITDLDNRNFMERLPDKPGKDFNEVLKGYPNPQASDLL